MPNSRGFIREDELKYYQGDYAKAKEKKVNRLHSLWNTFAQEYRFTNESFNSFYDEIVETAVTTVNIEDQLTAVTGRVGTLHVFVRKLKALMALQNPEFIIEPRNPGDEPIAWLLEKSFNGLVEEIQLDRAFRRMLVDSALFGTSIAKTGYLSEFVYGETPLADDVPKDAMEDESEDAYPDAEVSEYSDLTVIGGGPNCKIIKPHDVFFDLDARLLNEVRRIYHRSSRVVRDVQKDDRYNTEFREKFASNNGYHWDESSTPSAEQDYALEMKRGDIIECFDLATKQYCVFAEGVDIPARDWVPLPLDIENPFVFFQPIPDPESPWGIPYALTVWSQCEAKNKISARIVDTVSRHGKRVWLGTQELSAETIENIGMAPDGRILHDQGLSAEQSPNALRPLDLGNVDPEIFQLRSQVDQDLSFMSGMSDQTVNAFQDKDETATGVQVRVQSQGLSVDDMRVEYEGAVEDIARNMLRIMLQYWPEEELVKYVGNDPALFFWVPLERDRVQRGFTLKVRVGSTQKLSPDVKRKQMIDAAPRLIELDKAIVGQKQMAMQGVSSGINLEEYARLLLEELTPGLSDKIMMRRDPATLLSRLVQQKIAFPSFVPPELIQQLASTDPALAQELGAKISVPPSPAGPPQAPMGMPPQPPMPMGMGGSMAAGPMGPGPMPSFEEANRIPATPNVNQFGQIPMETEAGINGRMLSEAMGNGM